MQKSMYEAMANVEDSHWWYIALHELIINSINTFNTNKPLSILDAGCGTGRLLELMQPLGEVEGFDFSDDAIEHCRQRGLNRVEKHSLDSWKPKQESYDCITCIDVLCHASIKDEDEIIRKFHKSLKVGGSLIMNLPAFSILRRQHDDRVHTRCRYHRKDFNQKIEREGFRIKLSTYHLPHAFISILLIKLFEKMTVNRLHKTEVRSVPKWINRLLLSISRADNCLASKGLSLGFGSSLFIVAQKVG